MAACGSLEHIFENPLSEPPTFLESLSPWKHIKSMKHPVDDSSFTEIFGELHFKENHIHSSPESESSSNSTSMGDNGFTKGNNFQSSYYPSKSKQYGRSDTFSSKNSESLSLCTEGLGFESFDDVEDLLNCNKEWEHQEEKSAARNSETEHQRNESKISSRTGTGEFPPPISCIGRSGKPWVSFKSYREDGRFILKEIRIPTQEFLHACRENGRLKLHFIHSESDDEIFEEEEEDEEEQNDDNQERDWSGREREREKDEQNVENRDFDLQSSS
ncbi:hypothetical protein ACS0TY_020168 [Phlomoides rotata]